ncbi:hypothetical protein [Lacinutrix sp. MEBiC02595]
MSNKETLILFLIDKHPSLNNIYGLTKIFDRADFPGNVDEFLTNLKNSELIEIKKSNSSKELPVYKLTANGKEYLKSEFDENRILNFIKTMQNPKFLYELTELILNRNSQKLEIKELERITIFGDGKTKPEVESGIDIILIQDNTVQVGKLNLGKQYEFNMEIDHPKNQKELDILATKIIKEKKPEYLESKNSVIVVCPNHISGRMIWN